MHSPAGSVFLRSNWSRRRVIGAGASLGAGLALSRVVGARAEPGPFDADVGLDPGHSRVDVGASGAGVGEYQHTLDIAERIRPMLEQAGLAVNLSRADQEGEPLRFVEFWQQLTGTNPTWLYFDSKMVPYSQLTLLNQRSIWFVTIRRRGAAVLRRLRRLPRRSEQ